MSGGGLSRARERALVIATEAGDAAACRELVDAFLPAIAGVARQFPRGGGVARQELVQAGVAGLLFAARRFDTRLGTPFWAYASFWVRKAMQDLVAELARPIVLSDRAARGLAEIERARREHVRAHLAEPTDDELSTATGLTRPQIESLRAAARAPRALDEPLFPHDATGGSIGDMLVDPAAEHAYHEVLDRIELGHVHDSIDGLDERERTVVRSHYGLGEPARTLADIGGSLGVTAERARQIEAGALRKLRAALAQPAPVSDRAV